MIELNTRITDYLSSGGLFNPELMEHEKVRDLLIDCRATVANGSECHMRREWAMPCADTFSVPCIAGFVQKYLLKSTISIDPFARNKRWATYTNDLNPNTAADYHMDAEDFLREHQDSAPDLVIFDPPYSPRQIAECYQQMGKTPTMQDTQNGALYSRVRNAIRDMSQENTIVLSFGWNSAGMGKGWELLELLLVCHGGAHNDTICVAERRKPEEPKFVFA